MQIVKHEPELRRIGFGRLNRAAAVKVLTQLRRSGFERCNFLREKQMKKGIALKSVSVPSSHADALLEDGYFWTGLTYPAKLPITEDEMVLLKMIAPPSK